jgi:hypothetical protein
MDFDSYRIIGEQCQGKEFLKQPFKEKARALNFRYRSRAAASQFIDHQLLI